MDAPRLQHSPVMRSPLRNVLRELSPNAKTPLSRVTNVADGPAKPIMKLADFPAKPVRPSILGGGNGREPMVPDIPPTTARKRSFMEIDASERERSRDALRPKAMAPCAAAMPSINLQNHEHDANHITADSTMHDAVQNPDVSMTASQEGPNTQQTQSFSSLIDYNPHVDPANTAETSPKALEEANSPSSSSRAETLRLRLKVALYKVRTDQMNVPFHSLELSSGDTPMDTSNASESPPDKESLRQSPTASPKHPRNTSKSPALNPSPARSTSYPTTNLPPAPIPKLLPAPVLIPTSYSSRHIYAPHYHANRTPASSPPRAILSPERSLPSMTPAKSPTKKLVDERELTSSVVKGRAATGLLELRGSGAGEVVE